MGESVIHETYQKITSFNLSIDKFVEDLVLYAQIMQAKQDPTEIDNTEVMLKASEI